MACPPSPATRSGLARRSSTCWSTRSRRRLNKPRDGGTTARVDVQLARNSPESVSLTIADSGAGPADDVKQRLFDPFVTSKPDGAGLGLSVTREVIDQHGGRLFWRRADEMTYFTVELPVLREEAPCVETAGCR